MVKAIDKYEMRDALMSNKHAGFSPNGCLALAEWLDTYMPASAVFDVLTVAHQWTEYRDFFNLAENYEDCPQDSEKAIRRWLFDRSAVIEFVGGIIIKEF